MSRASPSTDLANELEKFYAVSKKRDGSVYERNSYIACRAALQRYISELGRTLNIYTDKEFTRANAVLSAVMKRTKVEGKDVSVLHKDLLSDQDWDKVSASFGNVETEDDPVKLSRSVWFTISSHFCLRGRKIQAQLQKDDLMFRPGEDGCEDIVLCKDFICKNHQGGLGGSSFETAVAVIKLYISHLNPSCPSLFQRAKPFSKLTTVWYINMPLSHNLLDKMMGEISEEANLSKSYTNHCVRASTRCRMKAANMDDRKICAVSGHKNVSSLQSHGRIHHSEAVQMSKAIDGKGVCKSAQSTPSHSAGPGSVVVSADSADSAPSDSAPSDSSSFADVKTGLVLKDSTYITFNVVNNHGNSWLHQEYITQECATACTTSMLCCDGRSIGYYPSTRVLPPEYHPDCVAGGMI